MGTQKTVWYIGAVICWFWSCSPSWAQQVCSTEAPRNYQVGKVTGEEDVISLDPGPNGLPGEGIHPKEKRLGGASVPDNNLVVRSRSHVLFLAIHVLGKPSKTNLRNDRRYKKMIREVNDYYKQCNLGFVIRHFEYVDHPKKVFTQREESSEAIFRKYRKPRLINVYYVDRLYSRNKKRVVGIGSLPAYLKDDLDRVVITKRAALSASTMAHELGHYFGLLHTHEVAYGKELVNGSNSHKAGDFIMDTPADPNLRKRVDERTCIYTDTLRDDQGDLYHPDARNIMSYALHRCRNRFSLGQCDRMRSRLFNERAYLERQPKRTPKSAPEIATDNSQPYTPLQWKQPFRKKLSDLVMTAIHRNQNKILILAGHPMVNWSRRLKQTLTHTPAIANHIRQHYTYAYLEVNERVSDFFKLTHDNAWIGRLRFYKMLRQTLHNETTRIPALIIIQFDHRQGKVTKSAQMRYRVIGYRNPREIRHILGITSKPYSR
mgnify:CR=1 FL=1